ncbi:hypothetical protein [Pontibacter burrus]|uniref:Lipoprotein n=1 Tax=Pontibacter burrus TaxID=2704466 RepID=A0A6B3LS91_9BACT|nr:hypothetical protein [Pontibacter burrus]NEM96838.1 hypothetical protein [Pontibacter burrus]
MKQLIVSLLIATILLYSCSDETIVKEAPIRSGSVIELVTFGLSENPTKENKGFRPGYYCYINLQTDSVYIQHKRHYLDVPQTVARAGYIKNISRHPAIVAYTEASKQYKNGKLITPKTPEGTLYCGLTFYTNYSHAGKERIHYFTSQRLDKRFQRFTDFVLALTESKELEPVNKSVPEDAVIVPIVNNQSFGLGPAPPWSDLPPPPVRATINFTPPLENR